MRLKIRGRWWRVVTRRVGRDYGECDYDAREIRLRPRLAPIDHLDTLIHEVLHAALPDLDEEAVRETATAIAEGLWRDGYRKGLR